MNSGKSIKEIRREKIVDAAQRLFARNGFRGTTMEGVAAEAGMSKVTLYAYFSDKELVFTAVAERLLARLREEFDDALASGNSSAESISNALIAKYRVLYKHVHSSQYSDEFFSARLTIVSSQYDALDTRNKVQITDVLTADGQSAENAARLTHIIFYAAKGLAFAGASIEQLSEDITMLVHALIRQSKNAS